LPRHLIRSQDTKPQLLRFSIDVADLRIALPLKVNKKGKAVLLKAFFSGLSSHLLLQTSHYYDIN
jgi:hypothetical protein